ncbi:MAG TPA: glycosyltransferase family 4 protein [Deltaproteobacteria bacterium]|nr:glycosyltransferase family 4 protein [Deltaproteobacteria bacterium]
MLKYLRPDVAISFTARMNVQNLIAVHGTGIPIIVSERNNPIAQRQPLEWEVLRKNLYPYASALVLQTRSVRRWAQGFISGEKIHVIPNPLTQENEISEEISPCPKGMPIVCSLGRLTRSKGFDILLKSFSIATADKPQWGLLIMGEGEERRFLEEMARTLGIRERVFFPGRVKNPSYQLNQAKFFVLSSRHEGFPNALLEAMAAGIAAIAADCPFGPSEIITHDVDGLLVPNEDIDSLSRSMHLLMEDREKRESLGARARKNVKRYSPDIVMAQWEELISRVTQVREIP